VLTPRHATPRSFVRGRAATVEPDCALRRPAPAGAPADAPSACAGSVGGGSVLLDDGTRLPYDWLVLALGADARAAQVPGAAAHAIPFVSLADVERCESALRAASATRGAAPVRVAVVGGGVSGVELAATLGARLGAGGDVALLTGGDDILVRHCVTASGCHVLGARLTWRPLCVAPAGEWQ
jgi:hypothetical protein